MISLLSSECLNVVVTDEHIMDSVFDYDDDDNDDDGLTIAKSYCCHCKAIACVTVILFPAAECPVTLLSTSSGQLPDSRLHLFGRWVG